MAEHAQESVKKQDVVVIKIKAPSRSEAKRLKAQKEGK